MELVHFHRAGEPPVAFLLHAPRMRATSFIQLLPDSVVEGRNREGTSPRGVETASTILQGINQVNRFIHEIPVDPSKA
jgi:hypothetical protein